MTHSSEPRKTLPMNRASPSTLTTLLSTHGPDIPLEALCRQYFGMAIKRAKEKAHNQLLPVPAYRTNVKGTWYIKAEDLARFLDQQADDARRRWEMVRGAA